MIGIEHYLVVSAMLFVLGVLGIFLNRKNIIVILMAIELILLSVNINLAAFSVFTGTIEGQIFAMLVLTVAAAEAAVAVGGTVVRHHASAVDGKAPRADASADAADAATAAATAFGSLAASS